ncbi:fungal chitosanase [Cordyceps javanica]|uniref:Endo-chitosanase n=1 Tax=Cordyceps javanica TaxID=43265 RepID=A0A545V9N4_9HYPO|nr:fungal chitosanase [Cordyceps javanica]TQW09641.1 fungal chitosanase [Cordyceps javanica]
MLVKSITSLAALSGMAAAAARPIRASIPTNVDGAKYNKPDAGPPGEWFAGDASLPISKIASAVTKMTKTPKDATYILSNDNHNKATIHSDWANLSKGAAYAFVADMDVDCDGIDSHCKGNDDGQGDTNFGALAAYEVPYVVIPDKFQSEHQNELAGNNLVAVICNGKLYYGVFGDTDGDSPQEIGEASWLLANTCFPGQGLNGGKGHTDADVTYIFFTGDDSVLPDSAIGKNYLTNFQALKSLGDKLMKDLVSRVNL